MDNKAPYVAVVGKGIDVRLRVEDEDDADIVRMAVEMAVKRMAVKREQHETPPTGAGEL